jgi:hypothetical protein
VWFPSLFSKRRDAHDVALLNGKAFGVMTQIVAATQTQTALSFQGPRRPLDGFDSDLVGWCRVLGHLVLVLVPELAHVS